MNGPPHLLGEVSNTSKTAQLKELRRFLFKRKFIWVIISQSLSLRCPNTFELAY